MEQLIAQSYGISASLSDELLQVLKNIDPPKYYNPLTRDNAHVPLFPGPAMARFTNVKEGLNIFPLQEMRTEAAARLNTAANTPGNTPYNPRPVEQSRKLVDNKSTWFS